MSMRMALAVAALLVGLTGLDEPMPHDPFGAATIPFDTTTISDIDGELPAIWRDERAKLVGDAAAVAACMHDGVPDCAAAWKLLDIVAEAKAFQGKALLGHINRSINMLVRPAPNAWLGPLEVLKLGDGDCKDYAIAKLFALQEVGVSRERLRLVIVHNRRRHERHMILAAYDHDSWIILDNLTMALVSDTEDASVYVPLFVLDDAGVRGYAAAAAF